MKVLGILAAVAVGIQETQAFFNTAAKYNKFEPDGCYKNTCWAYCGGMS